MRQIWKLSSYCIQSAQQKMLEAAKVNEIGNAAMEEKSSSQELDGGCKLLAQIICREGVKNNRIEILQVIQAAFSCGSRTALSLLLASKGILPFHKATRTMRYWLPVDLRWTRRCVSLSLTDELQILKIVMIFQGETEGTSKMVSTSCALQV